MGGWTNLKRVGRYGLIGFFRNGFVSLSAIFIMTITLFVIACMTIAGAALSSTLEQLTQKVDVNVYFLTTATEEEVLGVKRTIESLPEVASIEYTSREVALERFRERHKNDQLTLQALDELEENPLGASLAIQAKDTNQYESIARFIESLPAAGNSGEEHIIEKVNYYQNKTTIERLGSIIDTSRTFGFFVAGFFVIASILIAFNTIRLAIYTSKEEINIMRLVGAAHWYVRGPFVIAGILYGIVSAVIVLVALYPISLYLSASSEKFFGVFNTYEYFTSNFPHLFFLIMGTGAVLGAFSSYLAVRRYLKK